MGPMTTQDAPHHDVASTAWIPRAVRCPHCGHLAREDARERVSDDEVAVRYGCKDCRWHRTRHYHDSEVDALLEGAHENLRN